MAIAVGVASVAASLGTAYGSNKTAKRNADQANQTALNNAKTTQDAATEANNKANQKSSDSTSLLSSNQAAAAGGQSGTMLTGAGGIDPSLLQLGKSTLLGGGGG